MPDAIVDEKRLLFYIGDISPVLLPVGAVGDIFVDEDVAFIRG